eukprot:TRINITY_DN4164_c0_g1_i1.p1 TRINITY_DN4164_c0_g1~~TRINITY_DN4164_c0_g1_i1.p1  ORF type:complete len:764 (+),score=142.33 TRINITY_DN4164_c0_g1_i1:56-2347(+)
MAGVCPIPRRVAICAAALVHTLLLADALGAARISWWRAALPAQAVAGVVAVGVAMEVAPVGAAARASVLGVLSSHQLATAAVGSMGHGASAVVCLYLPFVVTFSAFAAALGPGGGVGRSGAAQAVAVLLSVLACASVVVGHFVKFTDSVHALAEWVSVAVVCVLGALAGVCAWLMGRCGDRWPTDDVSHASMDDVVPHGAPLYHEKAGLPSHTRASKSSTATPEQDTGRTVPAGNPLTSPPQHGVVLPPVNGGAQPTETHRESVGTAAFGHFEGAPTTGPETCSTMMGVRGKSLAQRSQRSSAMTRNSSLAEYRHSHARLRERFSVSSQKKISEIKWRKGALIGAGGFGTVHIGLNESSGQLMAVKTVTFHAAAANVKDRLAMLANEIHLMRSLHHPGVVSYYFAERVGTSMHIFMEYVPGGSLQSVLKDFGPLGDHLAASYTPQILVGLQYLHQEGFVHRDVKCANVLLNAEGMCKLADFGSAALLENAAEPGAASLETPAGTPLWMAPEVLAGRSHGAPCDIWSLGCCVMEMLTAKPPFAHIDTQPLAVVQKVLSGERGVLSLPPKMKPHARLFLRECLRSNPAQRPTAEALLQHIWISEDTETMFDMFSGGILSPLADAARSPGGAQPCSPVCHPAQSPTGLPAAAVPLGQPTGGEGSDTFQDASAEEEAHEPTDSDNDLICDGDSKNGNDDDGSDSADDGSVIQHTDIFLQARINAAETDVALRQSLLHQPAEGSIPIAQSSQCYEHAAADAAAPTHGP